MKIMQLLTASLFISVAATAQNSPSTVAISPALLNQPKPQLITTTALGKVYAMPTDNMPCLVPFATTTGGDMPVFKTPLYQNDMPNAIIPQQQLQSQMNDRLKLNLPSTNDNKNLMFELLGKQQALKNPL